MALKIHNLPFRLLHQEFLIQICCLILHRRKKKLINLVSYGYRQQIDRSTKIKTLLNWIWEWKKNLLGWWGVKNEAHTANCTQKLSEVLWAAMTQINCTPWSRDDGDFPSRALAVVYEHATSLAASDPIRWDSSLLGLDKTFQGPSQLYATHTDLIAGVKEMALKVTLRKASLIRRSSFGLEENKAFRFRFCQICLL